MYYVLAIVVFVVVWCSVEFIMGRCGITSNSLYMLAGSLLTSVLWVVLLLNK